MPARLWFTGWLIIFLAASLPGFTAGSSGDYEVYVVQQGQTLATIATDFGTTADTLAQFNKLEISAPLTAGQVIMVPASAGGAKSTSMTPTTIDLPVETTLTREPAPKPADSPSPEMINGRVGTIITAQIDIRGEPGRGRVIFSNAVRDMSVLVIGSSGAYDAILMADGGTGWLPKTAVALSDAMLQVKRSVVAPAPIAVRTHPPLLDLAQEYLGIPYRYGGHLPRNVDCSLFVQKVFARSGVKLPRTAAEQYAVGEPVNVEQLQPGDRLYFYDRAGTIGHTGIYFGDGRFIHASSNRGMVAIDELSNERYWRIYAGARR